MLWLYNLNAAFQFMMTDSFLGNSNIIIIIIDLTNIQLYPRLKVQNIYILG